jgi:hypothetical protein
MPLHSQPQKVQLLMNMDPGLVVLLMVIIGTLSARGFFKAILGGKSDDSTEPQTKAMKKQE